MATATQIEEIRATLQRGLENLALSGNLKPLPLRQQVERPSLRTRPIPPVGAEDPIHTGGNQIKQPSNKVNGNNRSNVNGSFSDSDHYRPGSARGLSGIVSTPFAKTQNSSLNGAIRQSSLNTKPPAGTRARPGRPSSGTKRNPPAMSGRTYHSANSQSKLTDTKVSSSVGRGRPLPHPPSTMSPTRRKEVVSSLSGTGSEQSKKSGKPRKDSLSEDGEEWCDVDENEEEQFDPLMSERMPGDGASYDDFDEDDGLDGLDDDGMDDDESDTYSTYSMSSTKRGGSSKGGSLSAIDDLLKKTNGIDTSILGSKSKSERVLELLTTGTDDAQPPLSASLFSKVPPTINFVGDNQTVVSLPWELRKLLKWRMSPITPHVVKNCIARSGFRATKKANEWLGYWGKHMKASGFKSIREYQKVNHVPGSFQIGRKDRLWRNLHRMQLHYGKKDYNFFPQTYVLPFDLKLLKRAWEDGGQKQKWILKPPASARGIGIKVIHKWSQIPRRRAVVVQRYLAKPYLINGSKFDLRIYVYVSSYDPLRIYIFSNGLARFATMKYSSSMKSLSNKFMHLTNYSINKKNTDFTPNSDSTACQGHKCFAGLALLEDYCMEGIHLATNKDDSHTWTPISSVIGTREPRMSSAPSCSLPMPVHPSLQKSSSAQSLPKIRRRGSKMRSVSSSSSTQPCNTLAQFKAQYDV
nr:tubulin monoglutamylase TTLL4-like [Lytechinus pictus]